MVSEIEIRPVRYGAPVAQELVAAAMADLAVRYDADADGDETPVRPVEFDPPDGAFLVAFLRGRPVGCGGWRSHGGTDVAEIKRMYTVPEARGRGVARALLRALEESARRQGRQRAILETGYAQPEAIAMYEASGYERIPPFGYYRNEPGVVSFGREL
jgi:GNAT superfamily N-acetyltransferase